MEKILSAWIARLCTQISGALQAQLVTTAYEGGPYDQIIIWPKEGGDCSAIASLVKLLLRNPKRVIRSGIKAHQETGQPQDILACPILFDDRLLGVVAIAISHRSQPMQHFALKQVDDATKWLETIIQLQSSASKEQLIDLVAVALDNDTFRIAVNEVVNQIAKRLFCQRVSLGFFRSHRVRVDAISHTSRIDRKTKAAQAIRDAMNEALDQAATVLYPTASNSDDLVTRFHAQLSGMQPGTVICTLPMVRNGKPVGALLLERTGGLPFSPDTVEKGRQIALLLGPVLETRRQEEQSVAAKTRDALKTFAGKLFGPKNLPLKVGVAFSIALLMWLALASASFRISGDAVLEAQVSRAVVAPHQGYIATAHARAGDLVKEGDLLASMDDQELRLEHRKWMSLRTQLLREYRKALAASDRAEMAILSAKQAQADAQLTLAEQQLARTHLVAPFYGLVIKGDLSQALGSPVERGEVLYEVAPTGEYRVVLKIDERDIGLVATGQQGRLKLSGIPDHTIAIRIDRLTPVAKAEEGRNFFRVEAVMESHSDLMRPGMEGVAKIDLGREKLLRIYSRQLVHWLRLMVWKYFP